jgi:2-oxoglutarate ferredoxin oxidoreductase subunit beta
MYQANDYLVGETAWCPGCGNFPIRQALAEALAELGLPPHQVLICSGIGQAAKMPHYLLVNGFNGLHGRALSLATGARIANKALTVVVVSGDGDSYGEGGNHLIHTIRRNVQVAHFVHNNQVYGLTKGQASPTSEVGMRTSVQTGGVISSRLNPLAMALVLGAGFVARAFAGEKDHLKEVMKAALLFPGYALVDILQPCPVFNKLNTYAWYRQRAYLVEGHDPTDEDAAMVLCRQWGDRIPLGIFYRVMRPTFEDQLPMLEGEPLALRGFDPSTVARAQDEFR